MYDELEKKTFLLLIGLKSNDIHKIFVFNKDLYGLGLRAQGSLGTLYHHE